MARPRDTERYRAVLNEYNALKLLGKTSHDAYRILAKTQCITEESVKNIVVIQRKREKDKT